MAAAHRDRFITQSVGCRNELPRQLQVGDKVTKPAICIVALNKEQNYVSYFGRLYAEKQPSEYTSIGRWVDLSG